VPDDEAAHITKADLCTAAADVLDVRGGEDTVQFGSRKILTSRSDIAPNFDPIPIDELEIYSADSEFVHVND
jgi:hypothetical protein